jgi:hypothetical protein
MIHCGIEEDNEALLARFFGRLNKDIQNILDYNTINHLFHLACKAEVKCRIVNNGEDVKILQVAHHLDLHVHQHHPHVVLHQHLPPRSTPHRQQEHHLLLLHLHPVVPRRVPLLPWLPRGKLRTFNAAKCWGYGPIEKGCRTERVMMVLEKGDYDSASDFDEETLALIAACDGDNSDSEKDMEVMGAEANDQFKSLVAQDILSVQLS